ncbi:NifB/NifX family molybdenum-iron cluster-binding protein [Vibrio tapetis subsp. quintayensis]|uniref:NifB/NifX family molybdenum-iron cluster-binding protein n=1 Tax=Vibrio tapetis TaxID=52443 RepID=UPI0025B37485|nr:NifB/NifX family molybdenum-iron cluster-binding protein [Vibrio tapetis]MDN3683087.1 NifB/NifX family molybdenum-iron cluster-binding protein [Vibrio tapetis subsp. quintayensis]
MYAIPYQNDRIAGHFSKAAQILFIEDGHFQLIDNPAVASVTCSGKKSLVALLKQQKVTKLVVRNIGQRMLAKLFEADIRVFHAPARMPVEQVLTCELNELTDISQARESINAKSGGCGKHVGGCSHTNQQESLIEAADRLCTMMVRSIGPNSQYKK